MIEMFLSIIAIVISVISFVFSYSQNRRLHNENKRLQVLPAISQELMIWSRIRCNIEKRNNGIDELNVLVSPYESFYNNNDIIISQCKTPILTLLSQNTGNGIGENVCVQEIIIWTATDELKFELDKILFSCPTGETVATRIYADVQEETIKKVQVKIKYADILGNSYLLVSTFVAQSYPLAEMTLVNSYRKAVKHR